MDKSTNRTIESVLEQRIRNAGSVSREFKAPQVTSGASGQLAYAVENPVAWDRIETLPWVDYMSPDGMGIVSLMITYTGDGTQKEPFAVPFSDLRIDGTGEANKVVYDQNYQGWTYGDIPGSRVIVFELDRYDVSSITSTYLMRWNVLIYYSGAPTYYLKLRASCTCPGAISVVRVS